MEARVRERVSQELQQRVERQRSLAALARALAPRAAWPYFAHLRLETAAGLRDFLLGVETRAGAEASLIDWQRAPLSEVFFAYDEGDAYDVELEGRILSGAVVEKNLVGFAGGELSRVETPWGIAAREGERWVELERPPPRLRSARAERRAGSVVEVELDPAQRSVVELPRGRPALVLGEAGCGKTTVALHRLAFLRKTAEGRRKPKVAVIVPTDALRRLTEQLLPRLGVHDAEAWRYDEWALREARRAFKDLPRRNSQDAGAGVVRLKRDPALRGVLEEVARRPPPKPDENARIRSRAQARREDLLVLFGDRALLERVAGASSQQVPKSAIAEVLEHTHVQFSDPTEVEYAHVDEARLEAVDGRSIDDATPMQDARSVDVEDAAVLFELDRLRARRRDAEAASPRQYDVVVIDEAQELAPLELSLVGRAVAKGGTLVVAGDAEQQVDPTSFFSGWDGAMAELGAGSYETSVLEVSYRCPDDVTEVARQVRAGRRAALRQARSAAYRSFSVECHLVAGVLDELRALQAQDPSAEVAVICRTPETARRLHASLDRGVSCHLALGGDFTFRPGVQVTCVPEVKGLEFEHVIVPDAGSQAYPDSPSARRALYVAITRATRQLLLCWVGEPSEILQPADDGRPGLP